MHALANRHLTPHSHPYAVVFKDRVTPCCMHPTGIHLLLTSMPTGDKRDSVVRVQITRNATKSDTAIYHEEQYGKVRIFPELQAD
jgi:hypothetical protein